ncbi:MAG: hypothetical protein KDD37_10735, partial [Bdellovibrionales bacterium]|nr:hypothetical protein [Bdellovibrionales bacterium]
MIQLSRNIIILSLGICLANKANALSLGNQNINTLNSARKLYAKNKIEESIKEYNKVPKISEFWIEATEEKAWAYVRLGKYDQALSQLKSIINPVFIPFVGPEAIMLATFIDLKTCNYKGVFDKIKLYKNEMLPRVEALESIIKDPKSDFVLSWSKKIKDSELLASDLGKDITKLPRYYYRDKKVDLNSKRVVELAKKDLEDISKNLKKMKIIEIEVIQRSYAYDNSLTKNKLAFNDTKAKDQMTFPHEKDSKEVWLDEIGNY